MTLLWVSVYSCLHSTGGVNQSRTMSEHEGVSCLYLDALVILIVISSLSPSSRHQRILPFIACEQHPPLINWIPNFYFERVFAHAFVPATTCFELSKHLDRHCRQLCLLAVNSSVMPKASKVPSSKGSKFLSLLAREHGRRTKTERPRGRGRVER